MDKKILLITGDYPPIVSGISTFFYNICRNLPEEHIIILAPQVKGAWDFDREQKNKVYRLPFLSGGSRLSQIRKTIFFLFYALRLIKKENISLLICAHPVSSGFSGLVFRKLFGLRYLIYGWGGESKKYKYSLLISKILKLIVRNAELIIVDSEYTYREYLNLNNQKNNIVKIPPGVDLETFNPQSDSTKIKERYNLMGKKVLLTVARLVERKGQDMVIRSLAKVKSEIPNVVYLIVGDGPLKDSLNCLVRQYNLEDYVIFIGEIDHREVKSFYNACDIYVMPNRETSGSEIVEGFGISFIEASACGKPVIGGRSGGVGDAVIEGVTGILVNPNSCDEIANAIIGLFTDTDYAQRLGKNGRDRVERYFSWQRVADQFRQLLCL
ncbi:MAG: glycosyltransferase family 4 protein [Candidatus Omnitrophota bacterium]